jgi:hypothetical protein
VLGRLPFFNLDCDRTSGFALKQNIEVLSHVTGAQLQAFGLVDWNSQNVTMVKIRA